METSGARNAEQSLTIQDDPQNKGVVIPKLSKKGIKTLPEAMEIWQSGSRRRTTAATAQNNGSSRSHAIFRIEVGNSAKFQLVDLAGSERAKKTMAEEKVQKEGNSINEDLLHLGKIISQLGKAKPGHISYRSCRLTRLLKNCLGGNSHTVLIACVSPSHEQQEETLATLRFASTAKKVKLDPKSNNNQQGQVEGAITEQKRSTALSKENEELKAEIEEVRTELYHLKAKLLLHSVQTRCKGDLSQALLKYSTLTGNGEQQIIAAQHVAKTEKMGHGFEKEMKKEEDGKNKNT